MPEHGMLAKDLPDPHDVRLFERLCDRFEAAWQSGNSPQIDEYLGEISERYRAELLRELLALELGYRLAHGDSPQQADYSSYATDYADIVRETFAQMAAVDDTSHAHAVGSDTLRPAEPLQQAKVGQQAAEDSLPRLPEYEVTEELGRGGMGVVYKARQMGLNRWVAVKMLTVGRNRPEDLARFHREAEVAARLQHVNVAQIYEVGQHEGQPFLTFEYVSGGSLAERLDRQPQPPVEAATMVVTLARAVQAAHDQGILHRDLKPANVLVTDDGTLKITDFGLAKRRDEDSVQTRTGEVIGSPSYMAPEQARGERQAISPASDVYALGAILYEMLTGRPPFQGATVWDTISQVVHVDRCRRSAFNRKSRRIWRPSV